MCLTIICENKDLIAAIGIKSAGRFALQSPKLDDWLNYILRRWWQFSTFWVVVYAALFAKLYNVRLVSGGLKINGIALVFYCYLSVTPPSFNIGHCLQE